MQAHTQPLSPSRTQASIGELLREWRQRRRLSQLDLAGDADVSTRHLSYLETGRAQPSREMVLRLAERLDVPLRERNGLLTAAGYAPLYRERPLDDPDLEAARNAVTLVLDGMAPFPALAVDRHWNLVAHNAAMPLLIAGAAPELLKPPVNVLRLSLHPDGVAPRIVNYAQWRAHLLMRLGQQVAISADPVLQDLLQELRAYTAPPPLANPSPHADAGAAVVPLQFASEHGLLSFFSTTTIFGTPVDITLSELAIESFFPADAATARTLRRLGDGQTGAPAA